MMIVHLSCCGSAHSEYGPGGEWLAVDLDVGRQLNRRAVIRARAPYAAVWHQRTKQRSPARDRAVVLDGDRRAGNLLADRPVLAWFRRLRPTGRNPGEHGKGCGASGQRMRRFSFGSSSLTQSFSAHQHHHIAGAEAMSVARARRSLHEIDRRAALHVLPDRLGYVRPKPNVTRCGVSP